VHLPETSLPAGVVRRTFLRELVIGVSTHTFEQAALAANSGADYIFYGPIFETPGKGQPVGIESLKAVCDSLGSFPVIGLGGIDKDNSAEVRSAGASGFAAIRSLNEPQSRRATCAGFNVFSR
jgi:thiamine-phosphate pyrophosphorylase